MDGAPLPLSALKLAPQTACSPLGTMVQTVFSRRCPYRVTVRARSLLEQQTLLISTWATSSKVV